MPQTLDEWMGFSQTPQQPTAQQSSVQTLDQMMGYTPPLPLESQNVGITGQVQEGLGRRFLRTFGEAPEAYQQTQPAADITDLEAAKRRRDELFIEISRQAATQQGAVNPRLQAELQALDEALGRPQPQGFLQGAAGAVSEQLPELIATAPIQGFVGGKLAARGVGPFLSNVAGGAAQEAALLPAGIARTGSIEGGAKEAGLGVAATMVIAALPAALRPIAKRLFDQTPPAPVAQGLESLVESGAPGAARAPAKAAAAPAADVAEEFMGGRAFMPTETPTGFMGAGREAGEEALETSAREVAEEAPARAQGLEDLLESEQLRARLARALKPGKRLGRESSVAPEDFMGRPPEDATTAFMGGESPTPPQEPFTREFAEDANARLAEILGGGAREAGGELPPVPEGFTRFYHGEGGAAGGGAGGTFFSQNPSRAAGFGPNVSFVDVPNDVADASMQAARAAGSGTAGDAILPEEFIRQAQPAPGIRADVTEVEVPTGPVDLDAEMARILGNEPPVKPPVDPTEARIQSMVEQGVPEEQARKILTDPTVGHSFADSLERQGSKDLADELRAGLPAKPDRPPGTFTLKDMLEQQRSAATPEGQAASAALKKEAEDVGEMLSASDPVAAALAKDSIEDLGPTMGRVMAERVKQVGAATPEIIREFRASMMLSHLATHNRNIGLAYLNTAIRPVRHGLTGAIETTGIFRTKGQAQERFMGEAIAAWDGLIHSAPQFLRRLAQEQRNPFEAQEILQGAIGEGAPALGRTFKEQMLASQARSPSVQVGEMVGGIFGERGARVGRGIATGARSPLIGLTAGDWLVFDRAFNSDIRRAAYQLTKQTGTKGFKKAMQSGDEIIRGYSKLAEEVYNQIGKLADDVDGRAAKDQLLSRLESHPFHEHFKRAVANAEEMTFVKSNEFQRATDRLMQNNPITRSIVNAALPFRRTPWNVYMTALDYTPLVLRGRRLGASVGFQTAAEKAEATAAAAIGTGVALTAIDLFRRGVYDVTPDWSELTPSQSQTLEAQGKKPGQIIIGGQQFGAQTYGPIGPLLWSYGRAHQQLLEGNEDDALLTLRNGVVKVVTVGAKDVLLEDLANFAEAANSPDIGKTQNWLKNYGRSFVPGLIEDIRVATGADTGRAITRLDVEEDPTGLPLSDYGRSIEAGLRERGLGEGEPQYDLFGRPRRTLPEDVSKGEIAAKVLFGASPTRPSPEGDVMAELGIVKRKPNKAELGHFDAGKERTAFQQAYGEATRHAIARANERAQSKGWDDARRKQYIEDEITKVRTRITALAKKLNTSPEADFTVDDLLKRVIR